MGGLFLFFLLFLYFLKLVLVPFLLSVLLWPVKTPCIIY